MGPHPPCSRLRALAESQPCGDPRENQAPSGAYLASPAFPVYRYSWFRDGAFIADAMSRAGDIDSAERFFGWCARMIAARGTGRGTPRPRPGRSAIGSHEFLPTRFTVDGGEAGGGLGGLPARRLRHLALGARGARAPARRPVTPYVGGVEISLRYIVAFWQHPCFDWWEEHLEHVHTSTLGDRRRPGEAAGRRSPPATGQSVRPRRRAHPRRGPPRGSGSRQVARQHRRRCQSRALATPFGHPRADEPLMGPTIAALEQGLLVDGGVHRYATDTYYGGGGLAPPRRHSSAGIGPAGGRGGRAGHSWTGCAAAGDAGGRPARAGPRPPPAPRRYDPTGSPGGDRSPRRCSGPTRCS